METLKVKKILGIGADFVLDTSVNNSSLQQANNGCNVRFVHYHELPHSQRVNSIACLRYLS